MNPNILETPWNICRELNPNPQYVRKKKKKKNRENTCQRKTITHTRQYLCGSTICLRPRSCRDFTIIREEYKVRLQYFLLSQKHGNNTHNKTLITKLRFRLGPPLHGLSLSKSPIKNHATLFRSGRIVKPDQTKLSSTKPNNINKLSYKALDPHVILFSCFTSGV